MAVKSVTLTMTTAEEEALARLIGYLCKAEKDRNELSGILGLGSADVDRIGSINAALNTAR